MKHIKILVGLLIILFTSFSCNNLMDLSPKNQFASEDVWNSDDDGLIKAYVAGLYDGLPDDFKGTRRLASYSDEALLTFNYNTSSVNQSLVNPSAYFDMDEEGQAIADYTWDLVYENVRACNLFFDHIDEATGITDEDKEELKGEVHFLRAFYYHMLVAMYGGVPIITQAYNLDDDFAVPRDTYADCINFIVEECDKAAADLGLEAVKQGKATKGAALALKSRVLLYAASDLHNPDYDWTEGYGDLELIGYTDNERQKRWEAARDAAKEVIDLGVYELYGSDPNDGEEATENYQDLFLQKVNPEHIFVRNYISKQERNNIARYLAPNGFHCYGGDAPTQQFVDSYEMEDGSKFSWDNTQDAEAPYENREPRFYASIVYDGKDYRERPADIVDTDPLGRVQTGTFEKWDEKSNSIRRVPGLDTRQSPIEDWNATYTGYYIMKFMDVTVDGQFDFQDNPWIFLRYGEILLNYAEALIGTGEEEEARKYINMIRKRAGLPDISSSGEDLFEDLKHERKIELAFEGHRFFDVRRWKTPEAAYENVRGIDILYKLNSDHTTYTVQYKVVNDVWERSWNPRFYFLPIKLDEMRKNDQLIQNPLYD